MKWNKNILKGFIIYPLGDFIAQLILGEIHFLRILILACIGGFVYSFEINWWFKCIDKKTKHSLVKTVLAISFFNPLWITRHFLIIEYSMYPENFHSLNSFLETLQIAFLSANKSFISSLFFSFLANYIIQNVVILKYRFMSSAIFSAIMNVYYALSKVFFS